MIFQKDFKKNKNILQKVEKKWWCSSQLVDNNNKTMKKTSKFKVETTVIPRFGMTIQTMNPKVNWSSPGSLYEKDHNIGYIW